MSNYNQNFRLRTVRRQGGASLALPLNFPWFAGNCAYVARGIDAPGAVWVLTSENRHVLDGVRRSVISVAT